MQVGVFTPVSRFSGTILVMRTAKVCVRERARGLRLEVLLCKPYCKPYCECPGVAYCEVRLSTYYTHNAKLQ